MKPGKSYHYLRLVQVGLIVLFVALTVYWLLLSLAIPVPYVKLSTLHKFILLSGELIALVSLYLKYDIGGWSGRKFAFLTRDFLIINCIFLFPFIKFYANPIRTEIPIISQLRPTLIAGYVMLFFVTIIFLYKLGNIREARRWINHQIDSRHLRDLEFEESRINQFQEKYPFLLRIPIIGLIAKNIYREGMGYLLVLMIFTVFGIILRLWKLGGLTPYIDELSHLIAAKQLVQGLSLEQLGYTRSLYTVTLPVALSFKFFGINLWAARLPGVLINIIALFPLYYLCKRLNKSVALIAIALYVFSPWMIAVARNVREYAYYPLIFFLIAILLVKLYEAMPDQIDFFRDYRIFLQWKILFYVSLLACFLYFVFFIDIYSTLKTISLLYLVFGLLLLRKIEWRQPQNIVITLFVFTIGVIIFGALIYLKGRQFIRVDVDTRNYEYFLGLFFEKPIQQWYYNRPFISVLLFVLALLAIQIWDRRKFVLPFAMLTFLGGLLYLSLLYFKGARPRYSTNLEFWFIILMAVGLFIAIEIGRKFIHKRAHWAVWLILLLAFWNIPHTFNASTSIKPGWHLITNEYHADIGPALSYLQSNVEKEDAIVTTVFVKSYDAFFESGNLNDNKIVIYDFDLESPDPSKIIFDAMETDKNGWIVLDDFRGIQLSQPVPLHDFEYHGKQVEFIGWFGNVYILRWDGE